MFSKNIIKSALEIEPFDALEVHKKMSPKPGTLTRKPSKQGVPLIGAVVLMFYEKKGRTHLFLIKRQDHLQYHPGQISFPGGRCEQGETFLETALRETEEEAGIEPSMLTVLGRLKPVYIPVSDFCVHPFVMWHDSNPTFRLDEGEVAAMIEVPADTLLNDCTIGTEKRMRGNEAVIIPYFEIEKHRIWGATAMIMSEMLERLRKILDKRRTNPSLIP